MKVKVDPGVSSQLTGSEEAEGPLNLGVGGVQEDRLADLKKVWANRSVPQELRSGRPAVPLRRYRWMVCGRQLVFLRVPVGGVRGTGAVLKSHVV